jgi:outer membrane receptor protein involved in Fe transport
MTSRIITLGPISAAALLLAGGAGLHAQEAVANKTNADEEVVVLPEFRVSEKDDGSYLATESTSGTRIAMPISSLPYSIQVMTADFINDFQLYDTEEQAPFISGMAPGDPATGSGSGGRLRGLGISRFRNGFFRSQAPESSSIERIEVIKGPMSAIYGRATPGGVINYISKKPLTRFRTGAALVTGYYDYSRVEAYATGPVPFESLAKKLPGKLYYRIDTSYHDFGSATEFYFNRTFNLSGGVTWKLNQDTSLTVEYEHTDLLMNDQGSNIRYIDKRGSTVTRDWVILGNIFDLPDGRDLVKFNASGSERRTSRLNDSYYAQIEHRITPNLSLRGNINYTERAFSRKWPALPPIWDPDDKIWRYNSGAAYTRNAAHYQKIDYEQYGAQFDLTQVWRTRIKQRSLLTFDYFRDRTSQLQWQMTGTALNSALGRLGLSESEIAGWRAADPYNTEPKYSVLPDYTKDPAGWTLSTGGSDTAGGNCFDIDLLFYGALFNHTIELFDGRLNLTASVRQDYTEIERVEPNHRNEMMRDSMISVENFSYNGGLTYAVIKKKLTAYVSYGTGFNPTPTVDPLVGKIFGNLISEGGEIGIKGLLMGNRFSYSVAFWQFTQENEVIRNPDSLADPNDYSLSYYVEGGARKGKGVGIDVSGQLFPGLSMLGNISWVGAEYVENEAEPERVGTRPILIPCRSGAIGLTYRPKFIKGARLGVSYKYVEGTLRVEEVAAGTGPARAPLYLPSTSEWAAYAGYRLSLGRRGSVDFLLNVKNLFDQRIMSPSFYGPNGRELRFTMRFDY